MDARLLASRRTVHFAVVAMGSSHHGLRPELPVRLPTLQRRRSQYSCVVLRRHDGGDG